MLTPAIWIGRCNSQHWWGHVNRSHRDIDIHCHARRDAVHSSPLRLSATFETCFRLQSPAP